MMYQLSLLPLRDVVVFPHMIFPFIVGRPISLSALQQSLLHGKKIFLAAQKEAHTDYPQKEDIYTIGTVANIVQSVKLPDNNMKVLVEGVSRGRIVAFNKEATDCFQVTIEEIHPQIPSDVNLEALMQKVISFFEQYVKLGQNLAYEALASSIKMDDPSRLADTIAAHLLIETKEKQSLLETLDAEKRLLKISHILELEIEKLLLDRKIHKKVKRQMEKAQREYFLTEKMRAIQDELGKKNSKSDLEALREKIEKTAMSKEAKDKAIQELDRLEAMPPMSAEATVSRNYIDWLLAVPWAKKSKENRNIKKAEQVLNADHYGLDKAKERILEFLAVRQISKNAKGSLLCFVGAPGTGKSSLAHSIARSTGRKFVRLSLGGVRDEAEIRGHRRTYIGAFPGQIIQMMKKAQTKNPVFLLDEIDKMSMDFRGDPSAALMEVLDPEQNNTFVDHYLDVEYDLSSVMFIATANVQHAIPRPLQDRMEIIRLSGYTLQEKLEIAKRHLLLKQLNAHGLKKQDIKISDEALTYITERYTREAGVRNLERNIAAICRKIARKIVAKEAPLLEVKTIKDVEQYLDMPQYRKQKSEKINQVGLAMGMAWTEMGGDILPAECTTMSGKGKLNLTGMLGEVMQESAQAALSYIRSRASQLGLNPDFYKRIDIHVHMPEGAIPKDGPSAGITMAVSMISALTKKRVHSDIAMTGEITLRGKVLPVGGIKEKVLGAHRSEIYTIILPKDNEKDLKEIPEEVRKDITIHFVEDLEEVLHYAMAEPLKMLKSEEGAFKPPLVSNKIEERPRAN
jgi:ATP-dependent Lon protease